MQKEEYEDTNMVHITWFWTWAGVTHQVELRHGRRSGIRKIYVNKKLEDRVKSMKNLLSDTGSQHSFLLVGPRRGRSSSCPRAPPASRISCASTACQSSRTWRAQPPGARARRAPAARPPPRAAVACIAAAAHASPRAPQRPPLAARRSRALQTLATACPTAPPPTPGPCDAGGPAAERPLDVGSRSVTLEKSDDGLGMTLRNNPLEEGGGGVVDR